MKGKAVEQGSKGGARDGEPDRNPRKGRPATARTTQADVAAHARVSTASVSRVLNGSPLVRPGVRQRVMEAIKALDYVPNSAARALALDRSHTIGAIIPTLSNAIFARGINAFERVLRRRGYTLLLSVSNYDLHDEADNVLRLIERSVDGVLLIGNEHDAEARGLLERSGKPVVCAWAYDPAGSFANVGFDNEAGMGPAVDHLVALGHRRIGMIAGLTTGNDRARRRLEGVRASLERHGLALPDARLVETSYLLADARAALGRLLDAAPEVTAVVCGNDVIAHACLFEAAARGLTVPGDLSLVGFDDLALSSHLAPALTTVRVPAERMGEMAAEHLLEAIEARTPVRSARLETQLIVRDSTARPRV